MNRTVSAILSSGLWLFLALPAVAPCRAGQPDSSLKKKSEPILLSRTVDGTEATLTFTEKQRHLILTVTRTDKKPMPSMDDRLKMWKPLLEDFFRKHGASPDFLLSISEYPELPGRIAVEAIKSGKWNLSTGRPRKDNAEDATRALLADGAMFHELVTLFEPHGYNVSVRSVEKATTCRWEDFDDQIRARAKASPKSIVPCGGAILFQLQTKKDR